MYRGGGARAKYVIMRFQMAHFHGCHGYRGQGCHGYKKNIDVVLKQTVLLIHLYHQAHGVYRYKHQLLQSLKAYILEKYPFVNTP